MHRFQSEYVKERGRMGDQEIDRRIIIINLKKIGYKGVDWIN